jgi:GNAT superfamily N-acetyltransferase
MSNQTTDIIIAYLEPSDLDEAYQISLDAFSQDAHTLFKMHEKGSTNMQSEMLPKEEIRSYLSEERSKKVKVIKALAGDKIVGFSIWGLWNLDGQNKDVSVQRSEELTRQEPAKYPGVKMSDPVIATQSSTGSALERLESITSGHMMQTLDRACQPTHPTIYCIGLHVDPQSQGLGVGTRMVRWATEFADSRNAAAWAHLSDSTAGIKACEKNGFQEVNTVTVDLDEYATKDIKKSWGQYSHHCMYRPPHA